MFCKCKFVTVDDVEVAAGILIKIHIIGTHTCSQTNAETGIEFKREIK